MNKQEKEDLIQALYDIGGCDAEDEWSRGYDDGVNAAIEVVKEIKVQEKAIVPKFVAYWFEDNFEELDWELGGVLINAFNTNRSERSDFQDWLVDTTNYPIETLIRMKLFGYEVEEEQLYWAVRGVTDYFRCDEKIIVFKKEEEALEVANLIGINTEVKKMNSIDCSECISIEELRNENEEPLFYVALPKIGNTEFCYLWTDTDGAVYTQGNKGLCIGRLKHTEQEIKSIDERYWPFAVKVDGKK